MTDRTALILLATALTILTAVLAAAAAGYLARRDQATWPFSLGRAATAFATTISLAAVLATTLYALIR